MAWNGLRPLHGNRVSTYKIFRLQSDFWNVLNSYLEVPLYKTGHVSKWADHMI